MLIKQCQFSGKDEDGVYFHLLHPGYKNTHLVKTASTKGAVLDEIDHVMSKVPRNSNTLYALVSAMGAWEYWGQNTNGDAFPEKSLIHTPQNWNDLPMAARPKIGRAWEWGYPTFYNAHAFQHHVNKDPARAFGSVVHAMWDPFMHRVLLVLAFERDKAEAMGAISVIDKIENGQFPDVSMGCFSAGNLVTMSDGTRKPIESVCVGDRVITHKGRAKKVTEVHKRRYKGDLYAIKAEAHRVLRCTHRHPFLSFDSGDVKFKDSHSNLKWREEIEAEPQWIHAECLSDQMLVEPIIGHYSKELVGPKDVAFARLLGYYLAEGHLVRDKKGKLAGIELTTHKDDAVHDEIDELCRVWGTVNPPSSRPRANSNKSVSISIFDKVLAELMLEWAGVYSTKKRLKESVIFWNSSMALEMLGAYANGDGCCYQGTIKFSTASEDLAWQLTSILPRFGILPSISRITHKAGSGFSSEDTFEWVVHVGKQWAPRLAPYCQKLQTQEVFKTKNSRMIYASNIVTPIREIEAMYVETDVYNLEVEEDESYVVEGIAVHNCKVPYDLCTRCTDWDRVTGNPKADLASHRRDPIRGLSETTKDYCDHLTHELGRIYSDGVKAGMINLHPRFFDLSIVFIGADKTSKVMAKLAGRCPIREKSAVCGSCKDCDISSTHVYEVWTGGREKVAERAERSGAVAVSLVDKKKRDRKNDRLLKKAFLDYTSPQEEAQLNNYFKKWKQKRAEIEKRVKSNFEPMLPKIDDKEDDLPEDVINDISCDVPRGLSTAGSLGIVLKPREFQRTMLISMGKKSLANELDSRGTCFRCGAAPERMFSMDGDPIRSLIGKLLPLIAGRSAFGPAFHKRIIITVSGNGKGDPKGIRVPESGDSHPLLDKLSSAYSDYRRQLMYKVASDATRIVHEYPQVLSEFFPQALDLSFSSGLAKTGGDVMESLIGMMPTMYLNGAYLDEPVSRYIDAHPGIEGIVAAGVLATRGRVA